MQDWRGVQENECEDYSEVEIKVGLDHGKMSILASLLLPFDQSEYATTRQLQRPLGFYSVTTTNSVFEETC